MANTGILSHAEYITLGGGAGAMGGAGFRAGDSRGGRSQPARTGHGNCVCGSCGNGVARKAVPAGFPLHQPDQGNRRPTDHSSLPGSTQTSHNQARWGGGALKFASVVRISTPDFLVSSSACQWLPTNKPTTEKVTLKGANVLSKSLRKTWSPAAVLVNCCVLLVTRGSI